MAELPQRSAGIVVSYVHAQRIGVLLEMSCESEFIASTKDVLSLGHKIAMQIAATDPTYLRKEEVPSSVLSREGKISLGGNLAQPLGGKCAGTKTDLSCSKLCLYEQRFIKEKRITISEMVASVAHALGGQIEVCRFVRFKLGNELRFVAARKGASGDGPVGVYAMKPRNPNQGNKSATATTLNCDEHLSNS